MATPSIKERIQGMTDVLRKYAGGDYAIRLSTSGTNDEIDSFCNALNQVMEDAQQRAAECRRLEEAFTNITHKYNSLSANIPCMIYQFTLLPDGSHRFLYVSDASRELFGLEPEDLLRNGALLANLIHPDDRQRRDESIQISLKDLQPWREELRHIVHGEVRWYDCMSRPVRQPNKDIIWDGIITEITGRKRAEDLIRARHCLSMELASASSLDGSLSSCLDIILNLSGMDCGGVYRVSSKTGDFNLLSSKGLSEGFVSDVAHVPADSPQARLVLGGHPLYSTYTALGMPIQLRQKEALRAIAIVPIVHQGKVIACYNIASHRLDVIPKTVQELLEAVVLELGNAVTRILAEEALREKTEELDQYFTNSLDLLCIADATGHFIRMNPAWERILGFPLSEMLGRHCLDFVHPEDHASTIQAIENLATPKEPTRFVNRYQHQDGTYRWLEWNSFSAGNLVYIVAHDITERKRVEEALRENEARYRAIIESQVDLISRYLPNTTITFVNDAYCKFYGKTREELIGHSYLFMIAPEFREMVRKETENLAGTPQSIVGEYLNYRHDGKKCWIQWAVQCIADENGQVAEIQAVGRDITERKQAEAELAQHRDRLEELVKERTAELEKEIAERKRAEELIRTALAEKEVLLREVHHRVKNNLNTIANILYFQTKTLEDKKALAAFQDSQNRIHSMARVHEHLYRSENLARVNMAAYFEELAADMQQTGETGPVSIRIDAAKEHLDIDRAIPCGLIVNELVTNSLKYAFPKSRTTPRNEVVVGLTTEAEQHILEVSDNGIGLPAGLEVEKSTSLGLRLVSMLTRQLKGRLAIDTEPGKGTKFTLTFPAEMTGVSNEKN